MLDEIPIFNSLKFLIVLNLLRHFNHHVYEKMIAFMVATNSEFPFVSKVVETNHHVYNPYVGTHGNSTIKKLIHVPPNGFHNLE